MSLELCCYGFGVLYSWIKKAQNENACKGHNLYSNCFLIL